MSRAVLKKEKDGRVTYIGHVPPEYKLQNNEYYEKVPNAEKEDYVE
ncbi:hypothetical protein [Lactobacillus bombicola]|nr:hypothetical protein [Lactobacillus bombicola]